MTACTNRWSRAAKRTLIVVGMLGILLLATYVAAEHIVVSRIRDDLQRLHGDDYAILRMNMGGAPAETPSLKRMLQLAYTYRHSDKYRPRGSGGFTEKKNYLVFLVSDNSAVYVYNWSFRLFRLDSHVSPTQLAGAPDDVLSLYTFSKAGRSQNQGLWLSGAHFNDKRLRFYAITRTPPESS